MFEAGYKPIQAIQKFNKLLVKGFVENGSDVYALSEVPKVIGPRFYRRKKEEEAGVRYDYSTKIDIKLFYNIYILLSAYFRTLKWGIKNRKRNSVAIFDVLQLEGCAGALMACKLLRIKTVAVVTDLPDLPGMLQGGRKTSFHNFIKKLIDRFANSFDSYVLLTEQMNEVVNRKGRPFIVMEGLCDIGMSQSSMSVDVQDKKTVIYAGGLHEEYGIKNLIDGFRQLREDNVELHLFGHGPMVEDIIQITQKDNRVKYFGIVPNSQVVEAEVKAALLVNPRPTVEDFTKYSFPSKNMEYMVSGTPVLTTILAGMPSEYHDYVYLLADESANGIHNILKKLLIDTPQHELKEMGKRAKEFVLQNKNNIYQSKRVIDFATKNMDYVGIHK